MKFYLIIFLSVASIKFASAQGINTNGNSSNNTANYIDKNGKINSTPSLTKNGKIDTLVIGDNFQGGIVAYILQPGDPDYITGETHGFIAAPSDHSAGGVSWSMFNSAVSTSTALGTGKINTNAIVTNQGAGIYAAKLCDDLVLNGYSDWYLPSNAELYKLYLNKLLIGGFTNIIYWSSSEINPNDAWLCIFTSGSISPTAKNGTVWIRAIRSF